MSSTSSSSASSAISLSGLASGFPTEDVINKLMSIEKRPVDQLKTRLQNLNLGDAQYKNAKSRVESLNKALAKLTSPSVLDGDPFKAKKTSSSDDTIATATATGDASPQTLTLEVRQLATATTARSLANVASQLTSGADLISEAAQGGITSGTFTVFVDGVANTVTVDATQDFDSVFTQLSAIDGITGVSVSGGKIQIANGAGRAVQLGANGDTSNFLDLTFLKTGDKTATSITSSVALTKVNLGAIASTAAANLVTPLTDGTFTLGKATFDTTGKTLNAIISEINNTADAGVTASYDIAANRLKLNATSSGSALITMSNGTGNFLTAMGLVSGGDSTLSQTAGENAEFLVNGTQLFSGSNTVSSSITGLSGVTLALKGENLGSTIEIAITRDSAELETALNDFVTQVNQVISFIDEQTDRQNANAKLKGETGLRRFRDQLRSTMSNAVAGLASYPTLFSAGISTGTVSSGATSASSKFLFDASKLQAALAASPDEVRTMMVGAGGILTQLSTLTENALHDDASESLDGLFAGHDNSLQRRIKDINTQISRAEERLAQKEEFYRRQFQVMEQLISQSNNQGTAISNMAAQIASNNS